MVGAESRVGAVDDAGCRAAACNAFIEGDNLAVLAGLAASSYDLIYIDPPYNTGNDFVYLDRVRADADHQDRHAAWTAMMRPRLEQARRVLAETGAIFVSIDDHEVAHLRLLLDEVFGEENLLATIVVNLNAKGRQLGKGFATNHEYLLAYARDAATCVLEPSSPDGVDPRDFPLEDPGEPRRYRRLPLRNTNKKFNPVTAPTMHYPLYGDPETGEVRSAPFVGGEQILPVFGDATSAVWRWSAPLVEARPLDLVCRRVRSRSGDRVDVFQKDWLEPGRRKKLRTIWLADEVGSTDTAVAELKALVGHLFESPKPTGLIRRILSTMPSDARVLDFFAGSGTTGHAVSLANAEDGGNRTCLSVNSAEPTRPGSNAHRLGYATVADVTRARLHAVAAAYGDGFEDRAASSPDRAG
ncbi:MAG: site-specific DNA-methyltransferase [Nocardioides sp.]